MALSLVFDYAHKVLSEPGFHRLYTTREIAEAGEPSDSASYRNIFRDEPTKTLMLRPLQLDPTFLNTPQQVDSIIRLSDMVVNATDTGSTSIFEAPAFGNNDNPFIYHVPVGPATAFPGAALPPAPGSAPSLVGIDTDVDPTLTDSILRNSNIVYEPSVVIPAVPPTITPIGDTTDGRFVTGTAARMPANQGLFFRWFHPESMLEFPCTYEFYVAQYRLRIKDVVVEVFRDTSAHGDRTAWKKVLVAPLFSAGSFSPTGVGSLVGVITPQAVLSHDRHLLWLPFRKNQVLLWSSEGMWALLQVNNKPVRLSDNSDWNITREDTVLVWVQTPALGRFQIQKLKYPSGNTKIKLPTFTVDYTPATPPTITLYNDADHGSTLSAARSQPPSYTLTSNDADDCPPPTTTGSTDPRREYGIELTLSPSGDQRWTPFFYGVQASVARVLSDYPVTETVNNGFIKTATLTAGLRPGEGRLVIKAQDNVPAQLGDYYYRTSVPTQLKDGSTVLFSGLGEPAEVTPPKEAASVIFLTFSALDHWKSLSQTFLRDQRDWTGAGHIDVVKAVCEQAGIDCTSAEFPTGYTPGTLNALNSPLGGTDTTTAQLTKDVEQGWKPRAEDTAAAFIERIANLFSGWYVGFRLDGTFFYLPREYFTSSSVTFATTHAGSSPYLYGEPTFTTIECEANVIVAAGGSAQTGEIITSSWWIDWASILNPDVVNYIGRWKAEIVQVGGTYTCSQLNWIARRVWEQTRRRRRTVSFSGDFVPTLKIGQVVTVGAYGDYRVTAFNADINKPNDRKATYEGELLEAGFGL